MEILHSTRAASRMYTLESLATKNGNDNGNGENRIAYIVVFEPKYTLLHLICLFKYSCFFQTYP
jgi:hypothetical protein